MTRPPFSAQLGRQPKDPFCTGEEEHQQGAITSSIRHPGETNTRDPETDNQQPTNRSQVVAVTSTLQFELILRYSGYQIAGNDRRVQHNGRTYSNSSNHGVLLTSIRYARDVTLRY
jgi:hypothetical protein